MSVGTGSTSHLRRSIHRRSVGGSASVPLQQPLGFRLIGVQRRAPQRRGAGLQVERGLGMVFARAQVEQQERLVGDDAAFGIVSTRRSPG